MSYDILAFEPTAVNDDEFSAWWEHQSQWSEDHSYDNSAVASPALQAFYTDLIREFPPMNGPDAPSDEQLDENADLEKRLTDYSIGASLVYAAFAWSEAETAREVFQRIAQAHGVAVAMVSDDGKIIRP